MAFGKTLKPSKPTTGSGDGEQIKYVWQWMNIGSGHRKFRLLPEIADGAVVKVPVLDSTGKVIKGKFTTTTESEVRWFEVWWDVMADGDTRKARVILNWEDPWHNPMWQYISKNFEKGSQERRAFKQRFGVNMVDMTPVLFDKDGNVVYADISGTYNISARGKRVETVKGNPEPLMQVRILEGSAGDEGGKHLLQQIKDEAEDLQDPDGTPRELHEVTLLMKTTGEGIKTVRTVRRSGDFNPLPDSLIYAPRYDIASWATPWPTEMLERIMADENFPDLVEEYGIKLFPELMAAPTEEVAKEAPAAPAKKGKATRKPIEDDEGLFDD